MRARHMNQDAPAPAEGEGDAPAPVEDETSDAEETGTAESADEGLEAAAEAEAGVDEPEDEESVADEPEVPIEVPLITALRSQLLAKDEQLKSYITAYKEANADMERERARLERDRELLADRERKGLAATMLDVLDNFDRSLASGRTGGSSEELVVGLELVRRQFLEALEGLGVERMTTLGETFDAAEHEATGMVPASGEQRDQEVIFEERSGYRYKGALLRPARVVVASRTD